MPRTPDRFPGESDEEGIVLEDRASDPTIVGEMRRNGSDIRVLDGVGVFSLRQSGTVPSPTQVGQILLATGPSTFSAELPLTAPDNGSGGWLVSDAGYLLVVG